MGMPPASSRAAATFATAFVRPRHGTQNNNVFFQREGAAAAFCPNNFGFFTPTASRVVASALPRGTALLDPATTRAAINFFDGSKFPAILVAGASLAALFGMTEGVNNTYGMTKLQLFLLRLYHVTSLLSFCLSLSSLVTSSTATTLLLLSEFSVVPRADQKLGLDAYHFLRSNLNFEFLFTRWSLFVSVVFLFMSTTMRMLLQFELFKPKRKLAGWSVVSFMTGVMSFIIGYANITQHCWPSFWGLTKEIFYILWKRAFLNRQPMFITSIVCLCIGSMLTIRFLMPNVMEQDQLADHDRYT